MMNPQALCLLPVFVLASLVIQIGGTPSPTPVLIGPDRAYLRSEVKFQCTAPGSTPPITYQLLKDVNDLVAAGDDPRGNHPLTFVLKVSVTSEGSYHCRATAGGQTGVSRALHLLVVTPVSGTVVNSDPAPPVLYEGARLLLRCDVTRGSHLSYTWFFNRQEVTSSPTLRPVGNTLVVERVAEKHAGNYTCMAGSRVGAVRRFSSSGEIQVKVKTYLSEPKISFTIFKEGSSYHGNITCQSLRGTPPVTFHLLLDNLEVDSVLATDTLAAWFLVAMVPGQDRGVACCRVESEEQLVTSKALTLYVAPVGGSSVQLEVEYLYRADSKMAAAKLRCLLAHGTFPSFSWSLNGSLLTSDSQSHALADGGRTLLLTQVTAEESGYYCCRARDSYDHSSKWVESKAELVKVPAVTMTTLEGIAIAFCCFLLLALGVGVACVMRMLNLHQQGGVPAVTPRLSLLPISFNPDALPLSDITSRSEVMQTGTSCVDSLVQNQEPL